MWLSPRTRLLAISVPLRAVCFGGESEVEAPTDGTAVEEGSAGAWDAAIAKACVDLQGHASSSGMPITQKCGGVRHDCGKSILKRPDESSYQMLACRPA